MKIVENPAQAPPEVNSIAVATPAYSAVACGKGTHAVPKPDASVKNIGNQNK